MTLEALEERIKNYHDQVVHELINIKDLIGEQTTRTERVEGRVSEIEDWRKKDEPFIAELRTVRKAFFVKLFDLAIKIMVGLALFKMGWGFLVH